MFNNNLTINEQKEIIQLLHQQKENGDSLNLGILTMDDELFSLDELFSSFVNINRVKRIWSNNFNEMIYDYQKGLLI